MLLYLPFCQLCLCAWWGDGSYSSTEHRALHSGSEPLNQASTVHSTQQWLSCQQKTNIYLNIINNLTHTVKHSLRTSQPINKLNREAFIEGVPQSAINPPPEKPFSWLHTSLVYILPPLSSNAGKNGSGSYKSNVMVSATDKVQVVNFMLRHSVLTNYHECVIDWYRNCQLLSTCNANIAINKMGKNIYFFKSQSLTNKYYLPLCQVLRKKPE